MTRLDVSEAELLGNRADPERLTPIAAVALGLEVVEWVCRFVDESGHESKTSRRNFSVACSSRSGERATIIAKAVLRAAVTNVGGAGLSPERPARVRSR